LAATSDATNDISAPTIAAMDQSTGGKTRTVVTATKTDTVDSDHIVVPVSPTVFTLTLSSYMSCCNTVSVNSNIYDGNSKINQQQVSTNPPNDEYENFISFLPW
jgi:hypothetical protein